MKYISITQEEFNVLNKSLSEIFDINYEYLKVGIQKYECTNNGWGGKTMGTTGFIFSEESKKKMSKMRKGKSSGRLGTKQSEETKQKISISKLGKKDSVETKNKKRLSQLKRYHGI